MQIATASDNKPWSATVYFCFNKDLEIFFISRPTRKHSNDIKEK